MVCLCLLMGIVLLVTPRAAFEAIPWNATRAAPDTPPDAVQRIIKLAALHSDPSYELHDQIRDGDPVKEDLLATVAYLAKRELGSR